MTVTQVSEGMTLKEYAKHRFFALIEARDAAAKALDTPEGKAAFISVSVQLHIAKSNVPKSYWRYANHRYHALNVRAAP